MQSRRNIRRMNLGYGILCMLDMPEANASDSSIYLPADKVSCLDIPLMVCAYSVLPKGKRSGRWI